MEATIIQSLITSGATIVVAYIGYMKLQKQNKIEEAIREQKQLDRLDRIDDNVRSLGKKVDIHNGYAEKFGEISSSIALIQKDIEYLKKGYKC